MTHPLEVLVIESQRGAGEAAVQALEATGHGVERCHDPLSSGFPCRGVVDADDCPLEHQIDVALVARRYATPRSTPLEQGVSCAIRAGLPVVEVGRHSQFDPYAPWLAARVDDAGEAVGAVERAAGRGFDELQRAVLAVTAPLLVDEGIDPGEATCRIERTGGRLRIRLELPVAVDEPVKHAVAVRALSALREVRHHGGAIDVEVRCPQPT